MGCLFALCSASIVSKFLTDTGSVRLGTKVIEIVEIM